MLSEARAAGVYDEGVADLRASSVTLKNAPEEVAKDPATGAITQLAQAGRHFCFQDIYRFSRCFVPKTEKYQLPKRKRNTPKR